jgi:AcrR family transcriptional regulator
MARPRKPRRQTGTYAAADERRKAIVDSAVLHFARLGYLNSSTQKIAADVGISHAGLLHHFGSKQGLLLAVLRAREEQAKGIIDRTGPAADPIEMMRRRVELLESNATQPGLTQLYTVLSAEASNPEHPAHSYFHDRYERLVGNVRRSLEQGRESGMLRPDIDPEAIAREIFAVWDGFQIQWGLSDGSWDLVSAYRAYLDGLARRITVDGRGLDPHAP